MTKPGHRRSDEEKTQRREVYRTRVANGSCGHCGKERERPERSFCDECIRKGSERAARSWRKRQDARLSEGMCTYCGKAPPVDGGNLCELCRAKHRAYQKGRDNREYHRAHRRTIRQQALDAYGGVCQCCGEAQFEFLTLDHIENDGALHRRLKTDLDSRHSSFIWRVRKLGYPAGLQVLCWNCNAAKGFYGGCPHQQAAVG